MLPKHSFWLNLANQTAGHYNDLQFSVLRFNGYTGSNADMYAAWRDDGFPTLTAVT